MKLKFLSIFLLSIFYLLFSSQFASAADFILVDWQISNYIPEEYSLNAKTSAISGSQVRLVVNLLEDLGKNNYHFADLKNHTIRWFNNGVNVGEFKGATQFVFPVGRFFDQSSFSLLVQVIGPGFETQAQKQIVIPVLKSSQATVHLVKNSKVSPYHQDVFAGLPGEDLTLLVKPYFFNVKSIFDLSFQWSHKGQKLENQGKDKFVLSVKLPKNPTKDPFSVFVQNSGSELEFVRQNFYLTNK
jgi:hypothetical protein